MSCPALEQWAAWLLGEEPAQAEALEAHLFECDACTVNAERMAALVQQLRALLPPLLTNERRARLERETPAAALAVTRVSPGEEGRISLGPERNVGFWVMSADVAGAKRLDCELLALDGSPLAAFPDVPFDAERGELVLCCQLHYRTLGFPNDVLARVTAVDADGRRLLAEYRLNHSFTSL